LALVALALEALALVAGRWERARGCRRVCRNRRWQLGLGQVELGLLRAGVAGPGQAALGVEP
jgi:hypothetical protein